MRKSIIVWSLLLAFCNYCFVTCASVSYETAEGEDLERRDKEAHRLVSVLLPNGKSYRFAGEDGRYELYKNIIVGKVQGKTRIVWLLRTAQIRTSEPVRVAPAFVEWPSSAESTPAAPMAPALLSSGELELSLPGGVVIRWKA